MGVTRTIFDMLVGNRREPNPRPGAPTEDAAVVTERQLRQAAALAAAAAEREAEASAPVAKAKEKDREKPRKPTPRPKTPSAPASLPALGSGAPSIVQVILPNGRVANHGWQALRPADLSPIYAALDAEVLDRITAEVGGEGEDISDDEAKLLTHISPQYAHEYLAYYRIDGRYYTTLFVKVWPSEPFDPRDWAEFLAEPTVTISMHWWRQSLEVAEKGLLENIAKLELAARELAKEESETARIENDKQQRRLKARLARIRRREETLYHVSTYFRVGADSFAELQEAVKRLRDRASKKQVVLAEPIAQHRAGFISSMPYASDPLYRTHSRVSDEAAQFFPFVTRPHVETDSQDRVHGILYGIHRYNMTPVMISPWNRDNSPTITSLLGAQGQGKSYWIRTHLGRLAMTGVQIIVIDPMNDFGLWNKQNGGQEIEISPRSKWHVNPLKLSVESYLDADGNTQFRPENVDIKIDDRLKPLFKLLLGAEYAGIDGLIGHGLRVFYDRYGSEEHLMADLVAILEELNEKNEEGLGPESLRKRLGLIDSIKTKLLRGEFQEYFAYKTNVELNSRKIVFNLKASGRGMQQAFAAYLAVTMAVNLASQTMDRKMILVDEIHRLFQVPESAEGIIQTLEDLVRTFRHWNTALTFATQFVTDNRVNEGQKAILKSTRIWILFRATEPMLKQAADLIGEKADLDVILMLLKMSEATDATADRSPRPAIIYRDEIPIPVLSVGFNYEEDENDKSSAIRED